MRKILSLLSILLLLSACADDKRILSLLDHAETNMENNPDSANAITMQ
ncbi:MAG: lipoprotein [Bacteroidaceae bacterium]|nr:lipoprotein [Bacteroidaceae bacterium]